MLAAEELGLAQRCLEMTVACLKERRQFRPADRLLPGTQAPTISQARTARYAGACPADGDPECVQRPGAIRFTWGHPGHLYLKRAEASSVLCGTRARTALPWRAC